MQAQYDFSFSNIGRKLSRPPNKALARTVGDLKVGNYAEASMG